MSDAIERAVADVLARGLPGGLSRSRVGVELGQHLQSAITADMGDGMAPGEVLDALQRAGADPLAYALVLELEVAPSRRSTAIAARRDLSTSR